MQVLLLSAQDAMLSRLILRGKAGKEERLRFGKLAFGARKAASTPDEDFQQARSRLLHSRLTAISLPTPCARTAVTSGPYPEVNRRGFVGLQKCIGLLEGSLLATRMLLSAGSGGDAERERAGGAGGARAGLSVHQQRQPQAALHPRRRSAPAAAGALLQASWPS